ncbi:MAG: hypothetical protein ACI4OI_07550 [Gemmiger sp.]
MPVVVWILRFIGLLLLLILGLLLLALLLPVGIRLEYRASVLRLAVRIGPVTLPLYPRPARKAAQKPAEAGRVSPASAAHKNEQQNAQKSGGKSKNGLPSGEEKPAPPAAGNAKSAAAPQKPPENPAGQGGAFRLPACLRQRVDAVVALAREDPLALARRALDHLGWFGRRMLRGIRITHLDVFWTVHCDEACATAVCYGQVMAVLNNLLALLRQWMTIRADSLRLEPDFTGHQAGEHHVVMCLSTHLCIPLVLLLRLVWRLWRDPALQPRPAHTTDHS